MHICVVTVVLKYICTILEALMWVFFFFWLKYVKLTTFCILHNFETSIEVALNWLVVIKMSTGGTKRVNATLHHLLSLARMKC